MADAAPLIATAGMADDGRGDASAHRHHGGGAEALKFLEGDRDLRGLGAGDTELWVTALSPQEADAALEALLPGGEIEYQQWYHMPDAKKWREPLKRLQRVKVAMADEQPEGLPWYRFPVNDQQRYGVLPMSPTVRRLRDLAERLLGHRFNHAVVLFYADGDECIGYHKDKTLDLDETAPIVSISLGHPGRPYVLRDDIFKPLLPETEVLLPHGSVLALGPRTNQSFYHAVRQAPHPGDAAPRVSVTFRSVSTFRTSNGGLVGKGGAYQTLNWPLELGGAHRLDADLDKPDSGPPPRRVAARPPRAAVGGSQAAAKPAQRAPAAKPAACTDGVRGQEAVLRAARTANLTTFFVAGDLRSARLAVARAVAAELGEEPAEGLKRELQKVVALEYEAWRQESGRSRVPGLPGRAGPSAGPSAGTSSAVAPLPPSDGVATAARAPSTADAPRSAVVSSPTAAGAFSAATECGCRSGLAAVLQRLLQRGSPVRPAADYDVLLRFWFGEAPFAWRGGLWWRGIHPTEPGCSTTADTDQRIRKDYAALIRSCANGIEHSQVSKWKETLLGRCALVVLLDQMPRNAFRGTAEMFAYDSLSQGAAREALRQKEELQWPHRLFCYVALMHSEDIAVVDEAAIEFLRFAQELGEEGAGRLKTMHREAKEHAAVLRRFGRYPHRNALLGRSSTEEEREWLRSKRLPGWAKSVQPAAATAAATSAPAPASRGSAPAAAAATAGPAGTPAGAPADAPAEPSVARPRVLVLHSNRQNPAEFQRRTRAVLEPLAEVADLVFAEAPHPYVPMGEAAQQARNAGVEGQQSRNRCWWNATDDPASMRYVGLDESLAYIDRLFGTSGPFDGVLGFSQGGCLAGLLAAMQPQGNIRFSFCAIISGFYCRDVVSCLLQLEEVPAVHSPGTVRVRRGVVGMPSFHSWGLQDHLVECWRSQLLADVFQEPVIMPHGSDHFSQARQHWPIKELAAWLQTTVLPRLPPRTMSAPGTGGAKQWLRLGDALGAGPPLTAEDVVTAAAECGGLANLAATAAGLLASGGTAKEPLRRAFAVAVAQEADPKWQQEQLLGLVQQAGWGELVMLDLLLAETAPLAAPAPHLAGLRDAVAAVFAQQLFDDGEVAAAWRRAAPAEDLTSPERLVQWRLRSQAEQLPRPTDCVHSAPRFAGAVHKKTHLALRIAAQVHELRTGERLENPREYQPQLHKEYRELLREIITVQDACSDERLALARVQHFQEWNIHGMGEDLFEKLRAAPLSDAVLHPVPEPLDFAHAEEIAPLFGFLKSGAQFHPNVGTDQVFPRGTVTADGRLDLCKQAIGPAGIDGLVRALEHTRRDLVQHLLLGNNMCGDELPARIAELISSGRSQLTTWYIAGNCITAKGLVPLCEALCHDRQVRQLWLKRNPLGEAAAPHLAAMLRASSTLQVLDLVNCGLLDSGAIALAAGLRGSALQHLYLDGNGLSHRGSLAVAASGHGLYTLSLGMNRLLDDGAQAVAEHAGGLVRLCLAACGISAAGARALAAMLRTSRTLRFLDLGLPKATQALGEVPNRISDEGTVALAEALVENSTLNGLVLVHNSIHQSGFAALAQALQQNRTLLRLDLEQLGIPFNELTREEIRLALSRNQRALQEADEAERQRVAEALSPAHLEEIRSVYRLGDSYADAPGADAAARPAMAA